MPRLEPLGAEVAGRGVDPHPVAGAPDAVEHLQRRPIPRLERAAARTPPRRAPWATPSPRCPTGSRSSPSAARCRPRASSCRSGARRAGSRGRHGGCGLRAARAPRPPPPARRRRARPPCGPASAGRRSSRTGCPSRPPVRAAPGARTQAMPANRAPFGPSAPKSRRARPGACSCLPAKRAPASKSISLPLLSLSLPRLGRRRPPAIWKGSASASGAAAGALPTRSARPDGSTPASRATSAQAVPLSLHGCAARRLNSAVCFGHGFPMVRLRSPATAMAPKRDSTCHGFGADSDSRQARRGPPGRAGPRDPQEAPQVLRALEAARHRRAGIPRHRRGRGRPALPAHLDALRAALDDHHRQRRHRRLGEGVRGRRGGERDRGPRLPPLPRHQDHGQVLPAEGPAAREEGHRIAENGGNALA